MTIIKSRTLGFQLINCKGYKEFFFFPSHKNQTDRLVWFIFWSVSEVAEIVQIYRKQGPFDAVASGDRESTFSCLKFTKLSYSNGNSHEFEVTWWMQTTSALEPVRLGQCRSRFDLSALLRVWHALSISLTLLHDFRKGVISCTAPAEHWPRVEWKTIG